MQGAVECAKDMAKLNGHDNIEFHCGDALKILRTLKLGAQSTFFVDPPRAGLGEGVCRSIIRFAPKKIIYVSCNPKTLADDLKLLTKGGYSVESVKPYDMFPCTRHVETVVCLTKTIN